MKPQQRIPLRNLRRARTLRQQDMALLLGVKQATYARYETGVIRPTVDMQARIAAILGAARTEVFPDESEKVSA